MFTAWMKFLFHKPSDESHEPLKTSVIHLLNFYEQTSTHPLVVKNSTYEEKKKLKLSLCLNLKTEQIYDSVIVGIIIIIVQRFI